MLLKKSTTPVDKINNKVCKKAKCVDREGLRYDQRRLDVILHLSGSMTPWIRSSTTWRILTSNKTLRSRTPSHWWFPFWPHTLIIVAVYWWPLRKTGIRKCWVVIARIYDCIYTIILLRAEQWHIHVRQYTYQRETCTWRNIYMHKRETYTCKRETVQQIIFLNYSQYLYLIISGIWVIVGYTLNFWTNNISFLIHEQNFPWKCFFIILIILQNIHFITSTKVYK